MNHAVEEAIGGYEDKVAAESVLKLSDGIKRVLEIAENHITEDGIGYDIAVEAPLMTSIIRQQQQLLREAYGALQECGKSFEKSDLATKRDLVGAASYRMQVARIAADKIKTALVDV